MTIYNDIIKAVEEQKKLLAVLIDPDKISLEKVKGFIEKVNASIATHIFIGGSTVAGNETQKLVAEIKQHTNLPLVIFPGDISQISEDAHALLFLSLISGENPEYLIGQHIKSVPLLRNSTLEVIPTGYILIESGKKTAVQRVTNTEPLLVDNVSKIVDIAKAGELLGLKLMYLEAGSGAYKSVPLEVIKKVKQEIAVPLIVGGGIRTPKQIQEVYHNGADLIVIGTAFENDNTFFDTLLK